MYIQAYTSSETKNPTTTNQKPMQAFGSCWWGDF
jgi:hypothetical protein